MTCYLCELGLYRRTRLSNGETAHVSIRGIFLDYCKEPERATLAEIKEELRNEIASSSDC